MSRGVRKEQGSRGRVQLGYFVLELELEPLGRPLATRRASGRCPSLVTTAGGSLEVLDKPMPSSEECVMEKRRLRINCLWPRVLETRSL